MADLERDTNAPGNPINASGVSSDPVVPECQPVAEPLDDKLVYIKPLRTLVRVQTSYADQIRDLCNASPQGPTEAEVIERCAKVAEECIRDYAKGRFVLTGAVGVGLTIASAIRSLSTPSGEK